MKCLVYEMHCLASKEYGSGKIAAVAAKMLLKFHTTVVHPR
jgi:hypothetical protein